MIYLDEPEQFSPKFDVVGLICEYNGTILHLLRQDNKPQANLWGLPAGKINKGDDPASTAIRELQEETGITAVKENLQFFKKVFVKYPEYDFVYHMFFLKLDNRPEITLNPHEHKQSNWFTPHEAITLLDQVPGHGLTIKLFYSSL